MKKRQTYANLERSIYTPAEYNARQRRHKILAAAKAKNGLGAKLGTPAAEPGIRKSR
jgi:hypothetical protein